MKASSLSLSRPLKGKGRRLEGLLEGFKGPELSPVLKGYHLRPLGTDVREHQRPGMIPPGQSSVMADQIHFHKARFVFFPLGKGADGDLFLEQGCWSGLGSGFEGQPPPLRGKQPVYSGSGYLEELFPKVFFQGQFAVSFKLGDYLGKDGLSLRLGRSRMAQILRSDFRTSWS